MRKKAKGFNNFQYFYDLIFWQAFNSTVINMLLNHVFICVIIMIIAVL